MLQYLRSTGYTWDEIARSMLVSHTTIWRKQNEAGITLERYSSISDADLDREVIQLQMRHPHSGQVLLSSLLETNGIRVPWHRLHESMHRLILGTIAPIGIKEFNVGHTLFPGQLSMAHRQSS